MAHCRARARGFTLLEVLVALSIFALIGIASYRVLSSVIAADDTLARHSAEMRRVNRAFWVMQQDLEQPVQRNVRDGSGVTPNWLLLDPARPLPLVLTRGGHANPLGLARSDMLRVAYAIGHHPDYDKEGSPHYHDDKRYLLRYVWPMLDGSGNPADALVQVLLPDVDSLQVAVQTNQGLMTRWPPVVATGSNVQVSAIRVELHLPGWGDVQRWYKVF